MPLAAIGTPWWIAIGAILLFGLLVVVRLTLDLVGQVKQLKASADAAAERLKDAIADVRAEADLAAERAARLRERQPRRRR